MYYGRSYHTEEQQRLRVFKNRRLRRIFELKREEVTGGWRSQVKSMRQVRSCSIHGRDEKCIKNFGCKT
jgi:hypothetical protein